MGLVLHGGCCCKNCEIRSAFGHGHSHGSGGGHGHSHGGGHGHSQGGGHGHSHGGGHGHSHDSHDSGHGHSHDSGHGHSHASMDSNHSNSHNSHIHSHEGSHSHADSGISESDAPNFDVAHSQNAWRAADSRARGNQYQILSTAEDDRRNYCDGEDDELLHVDRVTSPVTSDIVSTSTSSSADNALVAADSTEQFFPLYRPSINSSYVRVAGAPQPSRIVGGGQGSSAHGDEDVVPKRGININVRAAMVHVIGDLFQSIGVLVAAVVIKCIPSAAIADPICTFVFSFLVLCTTVTVLRDIVIIVMQGTPRNVEYSNIKKDLEGISGVTMVHSLNVWSLTMDKVAVGVHLAVSHNVSWKSVLETGTSLLRKKYAVYQTTIQVEQYDEATMRSCQRCLTP